jgi:hypothetical protein
MAELLMLGRLRESMLDEFVAGRLLRWVFNYRQHPPVRLAPADRPPELASGDRARFFQPGPSLVRQHELSRTTHETTGIVERNFQFPSPVTTPFPECNRVMCREWTPAGGSSGRVIVGVDGLVQFSGRWFRRLANRLVPLGWDVIMLDAPYNHRRTPDGYRPGQLIVGGDLWHQLNVSRQAVLDLWSLVASLRNEGKSVGLVGISLGAWLTTTVAQLADELLFLHAITPPLELAWLLREGGGIVRAISRGLGDELPPWDEVLRITRPVSPYHYSLKLPPERVMLHAARHDHFIPTPRIHAYARRYRLPIAEYPRGHISATCKLDMADVIAEQITRSPAGPS